VYTAKCIIFGSDSAESAEKTLELLINVFWWKYFKVQEDTFTENCIIKK
jgi:hypothetical protein